MPNNLLVRYIFALRQFGLFGNLRNKISELYQTSEMAQNKAIFRISVRNKKIPVLFVTPRRIGFQLKISGEMILKIWRVKLRESMQIR